MFGVTGDELRHADAYEVADYKRARVTLAGGREAWVYVDARDAGPGPGDRTGHISFPEASHEDHLDVGRSPVHDAQGIQRQLFAEAIGVPLPLTVLRNGAMVDVVAVPTELS